MAGYWIVKGGAIRDQAAYDEYARRWGPVSERFGARILNAGGRLDARENLRRRPIPRHQDDAPPIGLEGEPAARLQLQGVLERPILGCGNRDRRHTQTGHQ